MQRAQYVVSGLLGGLLIVGCFNSDPGDDTQSATTSTASTTGDSQSGSVTSAAGSATDETVGDSAPTTGQAGSTGEPCSFLGCDDFMPIVDECDNFAQNCPEGQKCSAYIAGGEEWWNALKCVDVTGSDEPGDPCTAGDSGSGLDSCIKGAMCWHIDMDGVGVCLALCTGTPDSPICEDSSFCGGSLLNLCYPKCEPLVQDCPKAGDACYETPYGFTCAPDESGGEGQANDSCEFINACDPGLLCEDPGFVGRGCARGSIGCCTPFCQFPDGACPNPDQQCVQYFDPIDLPADDPWLEIGVCGVPD